MRYINNQHVRRAADLTALNTANDAIGSDDEISWEKFLESNKEDASALRTGLWSVGCMKCWFSEAIVQQGEGHIEHFRPKGRLHGAEHAGYKWRTFAWNNLRFAHPTVNLRKTDYLTKKKMGKGSYFPLRDPNKRATDATDEANEEPVLLDPTIPSDMHLLSFDEASGAPTPRFKREADEWLYTRAVDSIDYYHLHEGTWNAERADKMAIVRKLCNDVEDSVAAQPFDKDEYNKKIDALVEYINPFAEFSSACLQVVYERGLLERCIHGC